MAMSKSSREYTCKRLQRLADDGCRKVLDGDEPCLQQFLKAAIIEGTAKLRPSKQLLASIHEQAIGCRYSDATLDMQQLLAEPATYKKAVAGFRERQKATEKRRQAIQDEASRLIDEVNLDGFESGQEAISAMNDFISKSK